MIPFSGTDGNDPGAEPIGGLTLYKDSQNDYILFGTTSSGGTNSEGTVFEYDLSTSSFTSLASLNGRDDGSTPLGTLGVDSNGDLFGTALVGGTHNQGSIFEVPSDGDKWDKGATPLYSLAINSAGGAYPQGGIVVDSAGNLFGTSSNGASCCGAFYELAHGTSGYVTSLSSFHDFKGPAFDTSNDESSSDHDEGAYPAYGLLIDGSGDVWGITVQGGGENVGCTANYYELIKDKPADGGCGTVFEILSVADVSVPLTINSAKLRIIEADTPGFDLQADVSYSNGSTLFDPSRTTDQDVTLTLSSTSGSTTYYTVSIPESNFTQLTNGHYAGSWVYTGVINDVGVSVQIDAPGSPDGDKNSESADTEGDYEFKANASGLTPGELPGNLTFVKVTVSFGSSAGSTTATPLY